MIIYIICFKTAHVQRNYIEISIEYRVSAHCPHQDDGGLSVLLVNPCQPSLLRYFDIGILGRGSHGITQIYPKRAHRLPFCKWSPPNSSTAKWWAQAIYALSHQVPSKSCHDECVPCSCPTHRNLLNCALLYILLSASSHTDCNYDIWYDICSIMFVGCCGTVWFGDVLGHWWQILIVHDSTMASWPWFRGYAFHAEKQRCPQCNLCALCEKRIVFVYEQLLDITLW